MKPQHFFLAAALAVAPISFFSSPAAAIDAVVLQDFSQYDAESNLALDHSAWDFIVSSTVIDTQDGKGLNYSFGNTTEKTGTRIKARSFGRERHLANRVPYHLLAQEHVDYIGAYRRDLEAIASQIPLSRLNKDEQLAYWLNLYNSAVFEIVALEFPVRSLEDLRTGPNNWWDSKILNVMNHPMSLRDIEELLAKNWGDPLIIYGLYQGTIGGPDLATRAYTGRNVYEILQKNAREYIATERAIDPSGRGAEVSLIYGWNSGFFENFPSSLIEHLKSYSDEDMSSSLDRVESVEADLYNWRIADVIGGVREIDGLAGNPAALIGVGGGGQQFASELTRNGMTSFTNEEARAGAETGPRGQKGDVTIEEVERNPDADDGDEDDGDDGN